MKKFISGLFITSVLVLSGCTNLYGPSDTTSTSAPEATTPVEVTSTADVTQITISGDEFSFSPSSITLKAGEEVRITFSNVGKASHDFSIEGLGIATKTIGAGKTDTLEFTAPSSGTYVFFCSVNGHRNFGMEGSLKVE